MKRLGVLLVDDEIMIREGFKRLFDWETHGCEVVGEAVDGMEALAKIDALVPDIVIMDINIPIMNGLKVIELARIKHPDMAFVVVSGYDDFSYCREALRLKITDYILKPVNYEEFGACIDNLKIARFQKTVTEAPTEQGERAITGLTRYLQAHLAEDISLGMLSDEFHLSAQYQSAVQKRDRREFPRLSDQHPHGTGKKAPAGDAAVHRGHLRAVRLRGLPRIHPGLQEDRGRYPITISKRISGA